MIGLISIEDFCLVVLVFGHEGQRVSHSSEVLNLSNQLSFLAEIGSSYVLTLGLPFKGSDFIFVV